MGPGAESSRTDEDGDGHGPEKTEKRVSPDKRPEGRHCTWDPACNRENEALAEGPPRHIGTNTELPAGTVTWPLGQP